MEKVNHGSGDEAVKEDASNYQLAIYDEDTQRLLESDDDESKAVVRYDTGDPQFLNKAFNDMRKLDALLQERFSVEDSLRRKRRRHLNTIRQTLSELQDKTGTSQTGQHEQENTRKFLSATELQSVLPDIVQSVLPEEDSITDSTVTTPITDSQSESTMSIPRRVNQEELEDLEKKWALTPFDNFDDDDEENVDSSGKEEEPEITPGYSGDNLKTSKTSRYYLPSFRFDSQATQVDHVKRNILCCGHFHTPEERKRLDELLSENDQSTIPEDEEVLGTAIRPAYTVNPFTLFGDEYKALQDLDEQLNAVRRAQKASADPDREGPPSSSFNSTTVEQLHFGFQKSEREACDEARRRFEEINTRLGEIESAENMMLERILEHSEPVEPLNSQENIHEVLKIAEKDLLAITYDASGEEVVEENSSRAIVPFLSEEQLQLLLGPFPRCSHFEELDRKYWHGESFEQWKAWLEDRQASLDKIHEELQEDRKRLQDGLENFSVEEMESCFKELMNDLSSVKTELDNLISFENSRAMNNDNMMSKLLPPISS